MTHVPAPSRLRTGCFGGTSSTTTFGWSALVMCLLQAKLSTASNSRRPCTYNGSTLHQPDNCQSNPFHPPRNSTSVSGPSKPPTPGTASETCVPPLSCAETTTSIRATELPAAINTSVHHVGAVPTPRGSALSTTTIETHELVSAIHTTTCSGMQTSHPP